MVGVSAKKVRSRRNDSPHKKIRARRRQGKVKRGKGNKKGWGEKIGGTRRKPKRNDRNRGEARNNKR